MKTIPTLVLLTYLILSIACAINPYDRSVWWAENIPIWIVIGIIYAFSRVHSFSNTSYILMAIFPLLHTIGGHYTFERVPFSAITELFNFSRNHFDRVAHFSVGFYAYPFAEYLRNKIRVEHASIVYFFPFCFILALAGFYEIVEWQYAISADAAAGIAVLGSQGDIWDAQKDMLADSLGAITVLLYAGVFRTLKSSPNYRMGK